MKKVRKLSLFLLGLPKTLLFNFHYFPIGIAWRLPVLLSHRVWLKGLSGTVEILNPHTGIVRIGFGDVAIFDARRSRAIWYVTKAGKVSFKGRAEIGHGSKIGVAGHLSLGDGVVITAESAIVANERIEIGDRVLISWDVLIMDTDFHPIYELASSERINHDKPVKIGNSVWIGCRSLILKGVEIADDVVIAAASTITKSVDARRAIVGGSPPRVIKEGITWKIYESSQR